MSCTTVNHIKDRPFKALFLWDAIAEHQTGINTSWPKGRGTWNKVTMMNRDESTSAGFGVDGSFAPIAQVRAYWEGLREECCIPLRAQISPRGLESALSSTFLIERVAPGIARFRIAGMDLADVMGMEVRGLPISAIFTPTARPALIEKLEPVFAAPAVMALDLVAIPGLGRPAMTARLILLPLRDGTGQTGLALGCIALTGDIGRSPRRFDIGRATVTNLGPAAKAKPIPATRPEFSPHIVAITERRVFAEAAKQFDAPQRDAHRDTPSGTKGKSYLRVVK